MGKSLTLLLLAMMLTPGSAQDSPSLRVEAYLRDLPQASRLEQVRGYFSSTFWDYTYAPLLDTTPQEQAELLQETAESVRGFQVVNHDIQGERATVTLTGPDGETSTVLMVREQGAWVIDLEWDSETP